MPYHECLRDLKGTRFLLRDFLVNGYHTRKDYRPASARTYDNERRRIEGLLGDALYCRCREKGKQYFCSVDAARLPANPLHCVYGLHNFTRTDISLHFLLLEALADGQKLGLNELVETVCDLAEDMFDTQKVRRKLNAYVKQGLIAACREKNKQLYNLSPLRLGDVLPEGPAAAHLLSFAREALPFGSLADSLMLRAGYENRFLRFEHLFLLHTLDDGECLRMLEFMYKGCGIR